MPQARHLVGRRPRLVPGQLPREGRRLPLDRAQRRLLVLDLAPPFRRTVVSIDIVVMVVACAMTAADATIGRST
jgi:hypothetical protein